MEEEKLTREIQPGPGPETPRPPKAAEEEETPRQAAYDWLESLVTAIVACILIFLFLFRIVNVDGTSMVPTLQDYDKIVITRLFNGSHYRNGDIVVLTKESFGEESIVKRVIATEGQTIDIDFANGVVYVDGVAQDEPYIAEPTNRRLDFSGPMTVPENCVFCMGDNRNASTDSRRSTIGMIDTRCILGRVVLRLWPLHAIGKVR